MYQTDVTVKIQILSIFCKRWTVWQEVTWRSLLMARVTSQLFYRRRWRWRVSIAKHCISLSVCWWRFQHWFVVWLLHLRMLSHFYTV